ncbi:RDD family protein [Cyclobacteriaceae bacterium]|nr:RDD family protein [Cyclobacteriaceae bacterium]
MGLSYIFINIVLEASIGQTIGKLVTQSKVINEYVENPSIWQCLGRAVIRFVPFEVFSNLGTPSRGWHDRWTNTYVVRKKDIETLK